MMKHRALGLFALVSFALPLAVGCSNGGHDETDGPTGRVTAALDDDGGSTVPRGAIVISQVYGAGGAAGASHNRDFVELFNRTQAPLSLSGLSLQYAASTQNFGATATDIVTLSGTIAAGGYFLVSLASANVSIGTALPTADQTAPTMTLDATNGKVALAFGVDPLACGGATRCASSKVVDLVGYGAVTDFEGTQSADPLDATKAAIRKGNGCTDTDQNRADLAAATPTPRNVATAVALCPAAPPKDAGAPKDAGPTPPVVDPPLGEEGDGPAVTPGKDAGTGPAPAGAAETGCSATTRGHGSPSAIVVGLAIAGLAAARARRRPTRR